MKEKKDKELKNALQSVVAPLLIGLRNDQVAIVDALKSLSEKTASKDSVKLQIINETEGARDVNVKNLPDVLKVEVTNPEKGIEEVSVKNLNEISVEVVKELEVLRQSVDALKADLFAIVESVQSTIKDTQTVEVKNQIKLPNVQKVELQTPIEIPSTVKISNRLAGDAIPVKLTTADGKRFYEAIAQMIGGGVDLYPIKTKLDALIAAVEAISVGGTDMTATNALITATNGYIDGLEGLLTTTNGYLDGVETAIASTNTKLDTVIGLQGGLDGTNSDGSVTLTAADTWKQVPPSGSVPDAAYTLIVSKETATGTIRFSFDNSGVPSATNGNKFSNNDFVVELAANEAVYFGSNVATDVVNWTAKKLV